MNGKNGMNGSPVARHVVVWEPKQGKDTVMFPLAALFQDQKRRLRIVAHLMLVLV